MALPKIDNTQIEKNQLTIIKQIDSINTILSEKLIAAVEKIQVSSTVDKMFPFVVQIADNLYNLTGKMGAQVTSLKEVKDVLEAQAASTAVNEAQQIEQAREAAAKKPEVVKKETKPQSALERFLNFLEKVLLPLVGGFILGLSKALGGFETTFGKILTIFAALYVGLASFRRAINGVVIQLIKALPELLGMIKGTIVAVVNGIKAAGSGLASGISKVFNSILSGITKAAPNATKAVVNAFREIVVMSANTVQKVVAVYENIAKAATSAGTKIANFFQSGKIGKAIDLVVDAFKTVFNLISKIGNISKVAEGASKAAQFFAKMGQLFAKVGKLLGPIGVIITTVMALFQGVKQAFKGFDEEGIYGAIKGFTAGIITGFIGWIGDLSAWLLGKLASLLGFEELGEKIASLDVSGLLNEFILNVFDNVKQTFSGFFTSISEGLAKIFSGEDIIGGIVDVVSAVPKMIADLIITPFKSLGDALKEVFNFDFAALAKKILIAVAPPDSMLGKVLGTGQMQKEVAASDAAMAKQKSEKKEAATRKEEIARMEEKRPELEKQAAAGNQRAKEILAKMDKEKPAAAPVVQPVQPKASGSALNTESQKVASARSTTGGENNNTNIVAPQSSVVNAPSSQVVNAPISAYGIFGGRVSHTNYPLLANF